MNAVIFTLYQVLNLYWWIVILSAVLIVVVMAILIYFTG